MCTTIPRSQGQSIQLKWHGLRRHVDDPAALRTNLEAGLQAGAAMEADIRLTRDGQWVCLHDEHLDDETTGSGAVRDHTAEELRRLRLRTRSGASSEEPVTFLDDLTAAASRRNWPAAELQLDVKATSDEITDFVVADFARRVAPARSSISLSGTDADVLDKLRSAVPGTPVTLSSSGRLGGARDAAVFASRMETELSKLDGVAMLWVNHRVLQAAYRTRFDLVGYARQRGVGVDTGTIDVGASGWQAALVLALQAKVDRITSNTPCEIARQVERWSEGPRRAAAAAS